VALIFTPIIIAVLIYAPESGKILEGFSILVLAIFSLFTNRGYILSDDKLIIRRLLPLLNKSIFISDIQLVRLFTKNEFQNSAKQFGTDAGPCGYLGIYYHDVIGKYHIDATNMDKLMLIVLTNNKKIAISPDDMGLLDEIKKRIQ
jgi:hypothetical protein